MQGVIEKVKEFFGFKSLGSEKKVQLSVKQIGEHWCIIEDDGTIFAGPYKSERSAKGQLTRYLKGYSAASRRPLPM